MHQVVTAQLAARRAGTQSHQDPRRGPRRRRQALEAEGHRPRPPGLDPRAALERRRRGPRPEAPQLRPADPQEDDPPRAALGAVRPGRRGQGRRRRRLGLRQPEDQGARRPRSAALGVEGRVARRARPTRTTTRASRASATSRSARCSSRRAQRLRRAVQRLGRLHPGHAADADLAEPAPSAGERRRRAIGDATRGEGPPRRHHRAGREREVLRPPRAATSTRSSSTPTPASPRSTTPSRRSST